jgi:hypothetical protein
MKINKFAKVLFWVFILSLLFACKKDVHYLKVYAVNNTTSTINLKVWEDKHPSLILSATLTPGQEMRQDASECDETRASLDCYSWHWTTDSLSGTKCECANSVNLFIK